MPWADEPQDQNPQYGQAHQKLHQADQGRLRVGTET